jgi:hypothetical protein
LNTNGKFIRFSSPQPPSDPARTGMIQSLEMIEANGFTKVNAAGGGDGLTLFVMMRNGRLQITDTMADTFVSGLENIAGITNISLDTSRNWESLVADDSGTQIDPSGISALQSLGDLLGPNGAAAQIGADVLIDICGCASVLFSGVALTDLDASDFLF